MRGEHCEVEGGRNRGGGDGNCMMWKLSGHHLFVRESYGEPSRSGSAGKIRPPRGDCGFGRGRSGARRVWVGQDEERGGYEPFVEHGVGNVAGIRTIEGGQKSPGYHVPERRRSGGKCGCDTCSEWVKEMDERPTIAKVTALKWADVPVPTACVCVGRAVITDREAVFGPDGRVGCEFESCRGQCMHHGVVGLGITVDAEVGEYCAPSKRQAWVCASECMFGEERHQGGRRRPTDGRAGAGDSGFVDDERHLAGKLECACSDDVAFCGKLGRRDAAVP